MTFKQCAAYIGVKVRFFIMPSADETPATAKTDKGVVSSRINTMIVFMTPIKRVMIEFHLSLFTTVYTLKSGLIAPPTMVPAMVRSVRI